MQAVNGAAAGRVTPPPALPRANPPSIRAEYNAAKIDGRARRVQQAAVAAIQVAVAGIQIQAPIQVAANAAANAPANAQVRLPVARRLNF